MAETPDQTESSLSPSVTAVSYTHLDVYKRQMVVFGTLQLLLRITTQFGATLLISTMLPFGEILSPVWLEELVLELLLQVLLILFLIQLHWLQTMS